MVHGSVGSFEGQAHDWKIFQVEAAAEELLASLELGAENRNRHAGGARLVTTQRRCVVGTVLCVVGKGSHVSSRSFGLLDLTSPSLAQAMMQRSSSLQKPWIRPWLKGGGEEGNLPGSRLQLLAQRNIPQKYFCV